MIAVSADARPRSVAVTVQAADRRANGANWTLANVRAYLPSVHTVTVWWRLLSQNRRHGVETAGHVLVMGKVHGHERNPMLVLSRKYRETITIPLNETEAIVITTLEVRPGGYVRLGIDAPKRFAILRDDMKKTIDSRATTGRESGTQDTARG